MNRLPIHMAVEAAEKAAEEAVEDGRPEVARHIDNAVARLSDALNAFGDYEGEE